MVDQCAKGRRAPRARISRPFDDSFVSTMLSVYRLYEAACERGGLVDFAELLLRAHELWLKDAAAAAHYQRRFDQLLVDEFQDTNTIQYAWLRVLAGNRARVTAVGDDDQSIYGWRGAKIENIHHFQRDFSDARVVRLEQNYRSTSDHPEAANALIANNAGRLGKELWTSGEDGEPITLYAAFNEQDEARFIVDNIERWIGAGHPRADAAILYRSNAQSRVLEEALIRAPRALSHLRRPAVLRAPRNQATPSPTCACSPTAATMPPSSGSSIRRRVVSAPRPSNWCANTPAGTRSRCGPRRSSSPIRCAARARNALDAFVDLLNQLQRDMRSTGTRRPGRSDAQPQRLARIPPQRERRAR